MQTARLGSITRRAGVDFGSPLAFWSAAAALPIACQFLFLSVLAFERLTEGFAPRWIVVERATSPMGAKYAFLYCTCWRASEAFLTRPESESWFRSTYRVLGANGSEEPSWASVIRPAGSERLPEKFLYFGPGGLVLVVTRPNCCLIAYDAPSRESWGDGAIEALSPFALLDENASLCYEDEQETQARLGRGLIEEPGVPRRHLLAANKSHPNPTVRKLAMKWLAEYDQRAETATISQY